MTEDDTFKALSRAHVSEMLVHYADWVTNSNGRFEDLEEVCIKHGWTWDEFSYAGFER